jgi:hypothetical protein
MADKGDKPKSFLGSIINDRLDGILDAAKQGYDDVKRNADTASKTIDGVLRDTNTSYLETELDPDQPLYTVMTKGEGKNARVSLWPDRLEWEKGRGISGGKVTAALLTGGASLIFTGLRGQKDNFETLFLSMITGVDLKRDGGAHLVRVHTGGGDIDFNVSRQNAAEFRLAIIKQMQVREATPQKVVVQNQVTTTPAMTDATEQLLKLGLLRDAGILTPEEFETKKKEILDRM